jgi:hypothetical protein
MDITIDMSIEGVFTFAPVSDRAVRFFQETYGSTEPINVRYDPQRFLAELPKGYLVGDATEGKFRLN